LTLPHPSDFAGEEVEVSNIGDNNNRGEEVEVSNFGGNNNRSGGLLVWLSK
jgi:hypothetical protein